MVIQYELSMDDVLSFSLYHHRHSPKLRRSRLFFQFGIPAICLLISLGIEFVFTGRVSLSLGLLSPLIIFSLIWIPLSPAIYWQSIKRQIRKMYSEGKNKEIFSKHELSLTPEALIEKSDFRETKTCWSAIEKVVSTEKHVFIYISAVMAHIIPKRAFADESKFTEFVETARQYHKNSGTE